MPFGQTVLTDDNDLIVTTGSSADVAYMGMLAVLLQWHVEDPVDDLERDRNDVVFGFQTNRKPFIDHPEWVECVFNDECEFCPDAECPADLAQVLGTWGPCNDCPAGFNGDGTVRLFDLALLLGAWGPCPGCDDCPADLDADCIVGASDLAILLGNWG